MEEGPRKGSCRPRRLAGGLWAEKSPSGALECGLEGEGGALWADVPWALRPPCPPGWRRLGASHSLGLPAPPQGDQLSKGTPSAETPGPQSFTRRLGQNFIYQELRVQPSPSLSHPALGEAVPRLRGSFGLLAGFSGAPAVSCLWCSVVPSWKVAPAPPGSPGHSETSPCRILHQLSLLRTRPRQVSNMVTREDGNFNSPGHRGSMIRRPAPGLL